MILQEMFAVLELCQSTTIGKVDTLLEALSLETPLWERKFGCV